MQVLQEIATYFQNNEPHSPVSYMLQKTIKWSQMPLHEWLTQVIKDEHPLQMLHDTLGVQPKNEYE
jgi:type VI secretion system protein ImpA